MSADFPNAVTLSSLSTSATAAPAPDRSAHYPTDLCQGPTITLPALKDRQSSSMSLFAHLRTMAARARAGIAVPPPDLATDLPASMGGPDPHTLPNNINGLGLDNAPPGTLPLISHASQTESVSTEAGDITGSSSTIPGPFNADLLFANVADGTTAAPAAPPPAAAPSTADKAPVKSKADPPKFFQESDIVLYNHIGLAPPIAGKTAIPQRERMIQNEVKMVAYVTSLERAASSARSDTVARNIEFAKILADTQVSMCGASNVPNVGPLKLELARVRADLNSSISDFTNRLSELASGRDPIPDVLVLKAKVAELRTDLLAGDNQRILASSGFSAESDPVFQALARDISILRTHIESAPSSLPSTFERHSAFRSLSVSLEADRKRFYNAITAMRADITSLYSKADDAERRAPSSLLTTNTHASVAPALFTQAPLGAPTMYLGSNIAPSAQITAMAPSSFHAAPPVPRALFAPAGGLESSSPAKRSAPVFGGLANKCQRLEVPQNPWPGRPLWPCYYNGLDETRSQDPHVGCYTPSRAVSGIRFKSRDKASLFCALVERYSPLPGQAAVFRSDTGTQHGRAPAVTGSGGVTDNRALFDLFGGGTYTNSER
ncbi:hypothetical protein B0H14DRAFT_2600687 [Mycena olivaceomarginata]|nr:hypothetical protein B0H14DRAFT_2600687 [Mycena olivaceomarginata]